MSGNAPRAIEDALACGAAISPPLIQSALRFLLIRYAHNPSLPLAAVIADSLEALLAHPDFRPPALERCAYFHLLMHWRLRCGSLGA